MRQGKEELQRETFTREKKVGIGSMVVNGASDGQRGELGFRRGALRKNHVPVKKGSGPGEKEEETLYELFY